MTIEINRAGSAYIYRISPTDARLIEQRLNKSGARWYWYARRDTPQEAKRMLLKLQGDEQEPSQ